jgi:anhydro-N-acetylmuramic acid kinase
MMSGTSLDGVDMALCQFIPGDYGQWKYHILATQFEPYNADWRARLEDAKGLDGESLMLLDREYGRWLGRLADEFLSGPAHGAELIGSHGHTVFHKPECNMSFQVGHGAAIHAKTGLPVVSDFRSVDVAFGGQGAPLVPIGDKLLFTDYDICLNLGGIANVSFDIAEKRIAFDVCPCNIVLNRLASKAGMDYDDGGQMASGGKVLEPQLQWLNDWEYYKLRPPKSLDKEQLLKYFNQYIEDDSIELKDRMATFCHHIAAQIALAGGDFRKGRLLITGGGGHHDYLIKCIRQALPGVECIVPQKEIVDNKEALIFAFLGLLRVLGEKNALQSVTGAAEDSVGGALFGVWKDD